MHEIQRVEDDGEVMRVHIRAPSCYANALRRSLCTRVSCLAFDYIAVHENSTCMPNELIAHRIGMLPVRGTGGVVCAAEEGSDRTHLNCVRFSLCVSGRTAMSDDLRCITAPDCTVHGGVKIAPMKAGQSLRLDAEATLGTGHDHGRWNSAVAVRCISTGTDSHTISFESTGAVSRRDMLEQAMQGVFAALAEVRRAVAGVTSPGAGPGHAAPRAAA